MFTNKTCTTQKNMGNFYNTFYFETLYIFNFIRNITSASTLYEIYIPRDNKFNKSVII